MEGVPLADVAGRTLRAWRVVDGELRLQFVDEGNEVTIRCRCGRMHWVVETRSRGGPAVLSVRCHACGTRGDFVLRESRLAAP